MSGIADAAAAEASAAAQAWGGHAIELAQVTAALRETWGGAAAEATSAELERIATRMREVIGDLGYLGEVLRVEGAALEAAIDRADGDASGVAASGPDASAPSALGSPGSLGTPGGLGSPGSLGSPELTSAAEADAALHSRLSSVRALDALRAQLAGPALPGQPVGPLAPLPSAPVDAATLASAWHELGPVARENFVAANPGIEDRAGLPAFARDQLNRAEIAGVLGGPPRGGPAFDRTQALAAHLRAQPGSLVLSLDAAGRGAVASGDPGAAGRVITLVPGTGSSMASIDSHAARAAALCDALDDTAPADPAPADPAPADPAPADPTGPAPADPSKASCVSVAWLEQDAPEDVVHAAFDTAAAESAAANLREFQHGLRGMGTATLGVLGYSYGGVVAGAAAAASDGGLDTDSLVFLASPGSTVSRVSDLALIDAAGHAHPGNSENVAAVAERWDPVPWWSITGIHGDDPHADDFGAERRELHGAEPGHALSGAHTGYFDPGSVSLAEIGAVLGRAPAA